MIVVAGFVGLGVFALVAGVLLLPLVLLQQRPDVAASQRPAAAAVLMNMFASVLRVQLDPWRRHALAFRYGLYALMLAWLYPMLSAGSLAAAAAKTTTATTTPPMYYGWIVLDTLVWCTAFRELTNADRLFRRQQREAGVLARCAYVCLVALGASAALSEPSRFLALMAVLPLALMFVFLTWSSGFWHTSRATRASLVLFVAVSLLALINALLGPVYAGITPGQVWASLTLLVHVALFADVLWINALLQQALTLINSSSLPSGGELVGHHADDRGDDDATAAAYNDQYRHHHQHHQHNHAQTVASAAAPLGDAERKKNNAYYYTPARDEDIAQPPPPPQPQPAAAPQRQRTPPPPQNETSFFALAAVRVRTPTPPPQQQQQQQQELIQFDDGLQIMALRPADHAVAARVVFADAPDSNSNSNSNSNSDLDLDLDADDDDASFFPRAPHDNAL